MTATNIIELARQAGLSNYKTPGSIWFPELEIAHILACLKRITYDGNQYSRVRRHLLILGPKGSCKSSISKHFLYDMSGVVNYSDVDPGYRTNPTVVRLDGGGVTWEKVRGGSVEGAMVMPSLHDCSYLYSSELFSFLGDDKKGGKMEVLNAALEEGDVEVNQLQANSVPEKKKAEFAEECAAAGITYNMAKGCFRYRANASMVACTRYLTHKQEELLDGSGFLSRFHVSEWRPGEQEENEYHYDRTGPCDKDAEEAIRAFNKFAWSCRFGEVTEPPADLRRNVMKYYMERYESVSRATGVRISELINERDGNDVSQLLTAFAAMRIIHKHMLTGDTTISAIEYTPEDAEAVKTFRTYHLGMMEERAMREAKEDGIRDRAANVYYNFLRSLNHLGEAYEEFKTAELAKYYQETEKVSKPTAYNRIAKLRDAGLLDILGHNVSKATDSGLAGAGLPTQDILSEFAAKEAEEDEAHATA